MQGAVPGQQEGLKNLLLIQIQELNQLTKQEKEQRKEQKKQILEYIQNDQKSGEEIILDTIQNNNLSEKEKVSLIQQLNDILIEPEESIINDEQVIVSLTRKLIEQSKKEARNVRIRIYTFCSELMQKGNEIQNKQFLKMLINKLSDVSSYQENNEEWFFQTEFFVWALESNILVNESQLKEFQKEILTILTEKLITIQNIDIFYGYLHVLNNFIEMFDTKFKKTKSVSPKIIERISKIFLEKQVSEEYLYDFSQIIGNIVEEKIGFFDDEVMIALVNQILDNDFQALNSPAENKPFSDKVKENFLQLFVFFISEEGHLPNDSETNEKLEKYTQQIERYMIIKKPLPDSWFHYQQGEYPSDYMTDPLILNLIDGSRIFDQFCEIYNPDIMEPFLFEKFDQVLESKDDSKIQVWLLLVSLVAEYSISDTNEYEQILKKINQLIKNTTNLTTKFFAIHAFGLILEQLEQDIGSEILTETFTILIGELKSENNKKNFNRIQSHAGGALTNIIENCLVQEQGGKREVALGFFGELFVVVEEIYKDNHQIVQENAVTMISSMALGYKDYQKKEDFTKVYQQLLDLSELYDCNAAVSENDSKLIHGEILEALTRLLEFQSVENKEEYGASFEKVYRQLIKQNYCELGEKKYKELRAYILTSWHRLLTKKTQRFFTEDKLVQMEQQLNGLFEICFEIQDNMFELFSFGKNIDQELEKNKDQILDDMEQDIYESVAVMSKLCDMFPEFFCKSARKYFLWVQHIFELEYSQIGLEIKEKDSVHHTAIFNLPYIVFSAYYDFKKTEQGYQTFQHLLEKYIEKNLTNYNKFRTTSPFLQQVSLEACSTILSLFSEKEIKVFQPNFLAQLFSSFTNMMGNTLKSIEKTKGKLQKLKKQKKKTAGQQDEEEDEEENPADLLEEQLEYLYQEIGIGCEICGQIFLNSPQKSPELALLAPKLIQEVIFKSQVYWEENEELSQGVIFFFCDFVEQSSYQSFSQFYSYILQKAQNHLSLLSSNKYKQAASYLIGNLSIETPNEIFSLVIPEFFQKILQDHATTILPNLNEEQENVLAKNNKQKFYYLNNALSSLVKILRYQNYQDQNLYQNHIQNVIQYLPIKIDKKEALLCHQNFNHVISKISGHSNPELSVAIKNYLQIAQEPKYHSIYKPETLEEIKELQNKF